MAALNRSDLVLTDAERARFQAKVGDSAAPACQIWTAAVSTSGYGAFRLTRGGVRKMRYAHQIAYVEAHGPYPSHMQVDHICTVRLCVNPSHLRLLTNAGNGQNRAGAQVNSASGVRGVHWHRASGLWCATVQRDGRQVFCQYFHELADAERAVIAARLRLLPHSEPTRRTAS